MDIVKYVEILMLLALIGLAFATIQGIKLRRSIIYMGAFSLLSSFIYLLYNAPDVAIAEAVIGCTISVILLLTALKRCSIMTIYYVNHSGDEDNNKDDFKSLLNNLEIFLIEHEFEPQLVRTSLDDATLHDNEDFDLLVVNNGYCISVYSGRDNYHNSLIKNCLNLNKGNIEFISLKEDTDYEG